MTISIMTKDVNQKENTCSEFNNFFQFFQKELDIANFFIRDLVEMTLHSMQTWGVSCLLWQWNWTHEQILEQVHCTDTWKFGTSTIFPNVSMKKRKIYNITIFIVTWMWLPDPYYVCPNTKADVSLVFWTDYLLVCKANTF